MHGSAFYSRLGANGRIESASACGSTRRARQESPVRSRHAQNVPQRHLHLAVCSSLKRIGPGRIGADDSVTVCLLCRPELVIDSTKDYSVAAVDPYESLHQQTGGQSGSAATGTSNGQGRPYEPVDALVEGKGMLSWTLAEKKEGTTMVCGRVIGPDDGGHADLRRPSKRRRIEAGSLTTGEVDLSDDDESDSDEPEETLEIWLQLTEVRRR